MLHFTQMKRPRLKLAKTIYYRYTLDCVDLLYVGVTASPTKRFTEHNMGIGSYITRLHPPRSVVKVEKLGYMTYFQATRYENLLTLQTLASGKNCRGGSWCGYKAPTPSVIKNRLANLHDISSDKFPTISIDFDFTRKKPVASPGKKLVIVKRKRHPRRSVYPK